MRHKTRKRIREDLFAKQKGLCHWCHEPMKKSRRQRNKPEFATIEHLTPLSEGGTSEMNNLALAHGKCNWTRNEKSRSPNSKTEIED